MGIEHANAGKGPAKVRQGHHDAARLDRISHGLRLMARALRYNNGERTPELYREMFDVE